MAFELGDVEIAHGIHGHVARRQKRGLGGDLAFAGGSLVAVAGDGGDSAIRGDAADAVVSQVGDIQVAGRVGGQAVRKVELGGGGRAAVSPKTGHSGSGDGGDNALGIHAADTAVVRIGEVDVAQPIGGDALDGADLGRGGGAAIAHPGAAGDGFDSIRGPRGIRRRSRAVHHAPSMRERQEHTSEFSSRYKV